ncbi:MAG: hypothetical protein JWM64_1284, partial [Frankiales bacterium]|nr:hypothetical protein [Frankiales bacterium]
AVAPAPVAAPALGGLGSATAPALAGPPLPVGAELPLVAPVEAPPSDDVLQALPVSRTATSPGPLADLLPSSLGLALCVLALRGLVRRRT